MAGGYDVCGLVHRHCESGDVLVERAHLPADTQACDILATPVTGAYGHSMGSNYNKIPPPPPAQKPTTTSSAWITSRRNFPFLLL